MLFKYYGGIQGGQTSEPQMLYITSSNIGRFLPCDAMRCTVLVIIILSVCLSVRPSVCHTRALCPHGSTYDHDFFTI